MRKEELFDIIGEVDEQKVAAAGMAMAVKKKPHPVWLKWGAMAACLCLVVAGLTIPNVHNQNPGSGDPDAGGTFLDGIDPVVQTIAVFPATETIENVENATIERITEKDAYSMDTLGSYLPIQLPEGYAFEYATLYETTMKNGTKYHMLRAIYSKIGSFSEQTGDGELAPDTNTFSDNFIVFVMDYQVKTEKKIYSVADMTENTLAEIGNQVFHISYGDIYVGISEMDFPASDMLTVINSIGTKIESAE